MNTKYFYDGEMGQMIIWDEESADMRFAPQVFTVEVSDVEEEDDQEDEPVAVKKPRKATTCSNCGEKGHQTRTCKVEPGKDVHEDLVRQANNLVEDVEPEAHLTEMSLEQIRRMVANDKGSIEIAKHFGITVKEANRAIAIAKGIELPN